MSFSAIETAIAIQNGEISCEEIVSNSLDSVKTHNKTVNAFCDVWYESALEQARTVDLKRFNGDKLRPLEGVPVGFKDLMDLAGTTTERGSYLHKGKVSATDSPVARRLKRTGAIIIGKTTTTELGWTAAGWSPLTGATNTPWDTTKTSGGSSSGSGAAIAARMVPLALGSDAGGSVRVPASFCGVFALKGNLGRIPHVPWSSTEMLSCVGPMSLTVEDSALAFDLLKGPHPSDHMSLPLEAESYLDACRSSPKGLRIAYAPTLFGVDVDVDVAKVIETAVQNISSDLPVSVTKIEPEWDDPCDTFEVLWSVGRGQTLKTAAKDMMDKLDPGLANMIRRNEEYSAFDYICALKHRAALTGNVGSLFEDYDLLLTPTVPILPFDTNKPGPDDRMTGRIVDWCNWTPFTIIFNLTQQPAASIPCGFTPSGLPVGLQVVGPRFGEAAVFRLCSAIEQLLPWRDKEPEMLQEKKQ